MHVMVKFQVQKVTFKAKIWFKPSPRAKIEMFKLHLNTLVKTTKIEFSCNQG